MEWQKGMRVDLLDGGSPIDMPNVIHCTTGVHKFVLIPGVADTWTAIKIAPSYEVSITFDRRNSAVEWCSIEAGGGFTHKFSEV